MSHTYLIRRGIVAELTETNGEYEVSQYEDADTFFRRHVPESKVSMTFTHAIRHVSITDKNATIVTEDAPCYRTIQEATSTVNYPIPWCYTIQKYTKSGGSWALSTMYIGITGQRILDIPKGVIYALPLNNIYADKHVCFGDASFNVSSVLGDMADRPVNTFWNSEFTREAQPSKSSFFASKSNWKRMKLDTVCKQEFKNPTPIGGMLREN
jgi:hypothetical protein